MTKMNNTETKPKGMAYGAASLTRVLQGIVFPATKERIIENYGTKEVNYSKSNQLTIKEIISKCSKETYNSMSELVESCARGR